MKFMSKFKDGQKIKNDGDEFKSIISNMSKFEGGHTNKNEKIVSN